MVIQFNPGVATAAVQLPAGLQKTPAGLMMAPASLTPLAPPSAPKAGPLTSSPPALAAEHRQAFFTGCQAQLLQQLELSVKSSSPADGSALTPSQRSTCASVLNAIVAQQEASRAA